MKKKKKWVGFILTTLGILGIIIYFFMKPIPREDWNRLNVGLSIYEVEQEIGNPDSEHVDSRSMLDCVNLDRQHYEDFRNNLLITSDDELLEDLLGSVDDELEMLEIIHASISSDEDIRVHEYTVGSYGNSSYEFAYFYKGSLVHRSGYLVSQ